MLEVYVTEGRNGKNIGWEIPIKAVGSEAENGECIQLPKCIHRDLTNESQTGDPDSSYSSAV